MEQNFEKQTTRHTRDCMWHGSDSHSKTHCLVCEVSPAPGEALSSVEDVVHHAQATSTSITAFFDAGVNLSHYGRVDHLAPAGAMAEFVTYVEQQTLTEAEAFFGSLKEQAKAHGVTVDIQVVHGKSAMEKLMAEWSNKGLLYQL